VVTNTDPGLGLTEDDLNARVRRVRGPIARAVADPGPTAPDPRSERAQRRCAVAAARGRVSP